MRLSGHGTRSSQCGTHALEGCHLAVVAAVAVVAIAVTVAVAVGS